MIKIDAHQHFWDPARGDYFWMTPEVGALNRVFGPDDLAPLLAAAGIDGTVLVQAAPTIAETDYMLRLAEGCDAVKGVVGWIDFEDRGHERELGRLAAHPKIRGVRPMIQDIADPDWMLRADIQWAFAALVERDLAFDALLHPVHLPRLVRLLDRHPDLRVVVDHGAKPVIREGRFDDWARDIARVAATTTALCKLSGLVTEAKPDWSEADLEPYVSHLLSAFGPRRLMFGSDWPVATLASTYARWVSTAERLTASCSTEERAAIFGGTAAVFYRLGPS